MIVLVFVQLLLIWFEYIMIRTAVRSFMKKNITSAPSLKRWVRVKYRIVSQKQKRYYQGLAPSREERENTPVTGKPAHMMTETECDVRYTYDGKSFVRTLHKDGGLAKNDELYCRIGEPEKTRWYSPMPPLSVPAVAVMLVFALSLITLDAIAVSAVLN